MASTLLPREVDVRPTFTIVFFGKCGVGKSSTLNKLFDLRLDTDHSIPCTKAPCVTRIEVDSALPANQCQLILEIVDMPGIGESLSADDLYSDYYHDWVSRANCLVWVTQADTRAYKRDQLFILKLSHLLSQICTLLSHLIRSI